MHYSAIENDGRDQKRKTLAQGDRVIFELVKDSKGLAAHNVVVVLD